MPKITGDDALIARIKAMGGAETRRQVGAALFAGGQRIQVAAQISITTGAVSGKAHVPSAPGEPPNNDTGVLANNIETVQVAEDRVEVSSNAPYAAHLEYGTSKMAERPYMRPAVAAERENVTKLVQRALNHVANGGKLR